MWTEIMCLNGGGVCEHCRNCTVICLAVGVPHASQFVTNCCMCLLPRSLAQPTFIRRNHFVLPLIWGVRLLSPWHLLSRVHLTYVVHMVAPIPNFV